MAIIGFNFTKIAAQKLSAQTGKIQIQNNIGVTGIEKQKFAGDSARDAVKVSFRYDCMYQPKVAHFQFEGEVTMLLEAAVATELVDGWKEKKAPAKTLTTAMNHVLERSNIQAIVLSREMSLPSPVPLPKVNMPAGNIKEGSVKTTLGKDASVDKKK